MPTPYPGTMASATLFLERQATGQPPRDDKA